jgi:thioredoxin 1
VKTRAKLAIVAVLAVTVIAAVVLKRNNQSREPNSGASRLMLEQPGVADRTKTDAPPASSVPAPTAKLPKLLDLGADKCVPCKMMAPILEELKREYAGGLEVEFIDVWKNPEAGRRYGVQMIPTQIFYDAEGRERFRHVGFISKEDILAKWNELGVNVRRTNP